MPFDPEILLITYINRSGSTYLLSLLDRTDEVVACPEADILVELFLRDPVRVFNQAEKQIIAELLSIDRKFSNWGLEPSVVREALDGNCAFIVFFRILQYYRIKHDSRARIIAFKATSILRYAANIMEQSIFRGYMIRLCVVIRDPRAVFNSQSQTYVPHRRKWMNTNAIRTAYQWNDLVFRLKDIQKRELRVLICRYESLIREHQSVLEKILGRYQLREAAVPYYLKIEPGERAMHTNIGKLPLEENIHRWEKELGSPARKIIEHCCNEMMNELGYSVTTRGLDLRSILFFLFWKADLLFFDIKRKLLRFARRKKAI